MDTSRGPSSLVVCHSSTHVDGGVKVSVSPEPPGGALTDPSMGRAESYSRGDMTIDRQTRSHMDGLGGLARPIVPSSE